MRSLVFLTGCGRSGTTILSQMLDRHPDITSLNDRFDLWVDVLPRADIWGLGPHRSEHANQRGSIELAAQDLDEPGVPEAVALIRQRLTEERADAPILVEKLAINNFRLGFLHAAFPEAAFINITRHGVEVAASIARKIDLGQWYGTDDRKWTLLCEHAHRVGLGEWANTCRRAHERGLLEWRMSVDAASAFFSSSPSAKALHVTYEHLLDDPSGMTTTLTAFLGCHDDPGMRDWATAHVKRASPSATKADAQMMDAAERIAGPALQRLGYSLFASAESAR